MDSSRQIRGRDYERNRSTYAMWKTFTLQNPPHHRYPGQTGIRQFGGRSGNCTRQTRVVRTSGTGTRDRTRVVLMYNHPSFRTSLHENHRVSLHPPSPSRMFLPTQLPKNKHVGMTQTDIVIPIQKFHPNESFPKRSVPSTPTGVDTVRSLLLLVCEVLFTKLTTPLQIYEIFDILFLDGSRSDSKGCPSL